MQMKNVLGDYTPEELKSLVQTLWNADLDNETHARLIDHFDKIIGDPFGADLLFYPPNRDTGNDHSVNSVMFHIKRWRNTNGCVAFRSEPATLVSLSSPVRLSSTISSLSGSRS